MNATTIKVHTETKGLLDKFRQYRNESYDELIRKIVFLAQSEPTLREETIDAIEKARARINAGKFVTEQQAMKRLGF